MSNNPSDGRAVLFDVDGTLLDTIPQIIDSYQYTFRTCLGHEIDVDMILASIGTPLDTFFSQWWPEQALAMRKVYLEHNQARAETHIGIFRHVPALLEAVAGLGIPMAVVTSKRRDSAMRNLATFQLTDCFQAIIVKESTTRHKPDPEPVFEAMRQLGLSDPGRIMFVGDSMHDLMCARQAGCRAAIVDWTAMPANQLMAEKPDLWLTGPQMLTDYLRTL